MQLNKEVYEAVARMRKQAQLLEDAAIAVVAEADAQLAKFQEDPNVKKPISELQYGKAFIRRGVRCIKTRPTGHMLNSTLVSETLASGKFFIVDTTKGTLYIVPNDIVTPTE